MFTHKKNFSPKYLLTNFFNHTKILVTKKVWSQKNFSHKKILVTKKL